jgi:hypothetical protein
LMTTTRNSRSTTAMACGWHRADCPPQPWENGSEIRRSWVSLVGGATAGRPHPIENRHG